MTKVNSKSSQSNVGHVAAPSGRMPLARGPYLVIFGLVTLLISRVINYVQPSPFIDEIFHVRQALNYCNGRYLEWDPKITTLPGLYCFTVGLFKPLGYIMNFDPCTIEWLRFTNVIGAHVNLVLIYEIFAIKNVTLGASNDIFKKIIVSMLCLGTFPVLYFFSFLYYTDTLSTTMILLMYVLHLSRRYYISAAIGLLAVLTRQTNIIWVFYVAAELVIEDLLDFRRKTRAMRRSRGQTYYKMISSIVKHVIFHGTLKCVAGYIMVGILFVYFVTVNKGLVVGDRSAHQPVIHLMQLAYFATFCLLFTLPHAINSLKSFYRACSVLKNVVFISVCIVIICFIVHKNTLVHPYLLADNRHYIFYVWSRLYNATSYFRYFIIPVYILAFYHLQKTSAIRLFPLYAVCVFFNIVPQMLLELRYFILPFMIYRLHVNLNNIKLRDLMFELLINCCINAFTIIIFAKKKFYWADSNEIQRIIW